MDKALAQIEANPAEWDQGHWVCRTGCCFLGTATLVADDRFPNLPELDRVFSHTSVSWDEVFGPTADQMGLHSDHPIFNANNELDDLRDYREVYAAHLEDIEESTNDHL